MAFAKTLTIGTGTPVPESPQTQSVSVIVTYEIERGDTDLLALASEKAEEVEAVRTTVLHGIQAIPREKSAAGNAELTEEPSAISGREQRRRSRKADTTAQPADEPKAASTGATAESVVPTDELTASGQTGGPAEHADLQAYEPVMNVQKIAIRSLAARKGHTPESLTQALTQAYSKASIDDLTKAEAREFLTTLQRDETAPAAQAA